MQKGRDRTGRQIFSAGVPSKNRVSPPQEKNVFARAKKFSTHPRHATNRAKEITHEMDRNLEKLYFQTPLSIMFL